MRTAPINPKFSKFVSETLIHGLFLGSLDLFLDEQIRSVQKGILPRRFLLFLISISWWLGLMVFFLGSMVGYGTSTLNFWSWIFSSMGTDEPSAWIFWLTDSGAPVLTSLAVISVGVTAIHRRAEYLIWAVVPVLLYPSVLSLPGAWTLILASRLTLWGKLILKNPNSVVTTDLWIRGLIASIFLLAVIFLGSIVSSGGLGNPLLRTLQATLGLALLTLVETVLCSALYHFRT